MNIISAALTRRHLSLTANQEIARDIGLAIVSHKYNTKLPTEKEFSSYYGVSRGVIREALKILQGKNLISIAKPQGIFVEHKSKWNVFDSSLLEWSLESQSSSTLIREINEVRFAVEPMIAGTAASKMNPKQLSEVHISLKDIEASNDRVRQRPVSIIVFHKMLIEFSGSMVYAQFSKLIEIGIACQSNSHFKSTKEALFDLSLYENLYESLENQNSKQAAHRMRKILENASKPNIQNAVKK